MKNRIHDSNSDHSTAQDGQTQRLTKMPIADSVFKQLRSIHWWMAWCYVVLFTVGWGMTHLPKEASYRALFYDFHKSVGVLTVAILTWRILVLLQVWRQKYTKQLPNFTIRWFKKFILHALLYGFMWAVPVTGVFLSNSFQANNVRFFGMKLPDIFVQNSAIVELAKNLHFWFAYIFLAFILLHLLVQRKVIRSYQSQLWVWLRTRFIQS
jgi:cytochrome b561